MWSHFSTFLLHEICFVSKKNILIALFSMSLAKKLVDVSGDAKDGVTVVPPVLSVAVVIGNSAKILAGVQV